VAPVDDVIAENEQWQMLISLPAPRGRGAGHATDRFSLAGCTPAGSSDAG
jgi:hypothetical protein